LTPCNPSLFFQISNLQAAYASLFTIEPKPYAGILAHWAVYQHSYQTTDVNIHLGEVRPNHVSFEP
jgi:hypothetical protein